MLAAVSNDFVPPIDLRSSTTQAVLTDTAPGVEGSYLADLGRQANLLAHADGGRLVGLLSFASPFVDARFEICGECTYVTTVAVSRGYRRQGIARVLYEALFGLPEARSRSILLRTWSGNAEHLKLLHSLGFGQLARLTDDRGPGVDTLYLARQGA